MEILETLAQFVVFIGNVLSKYVGRIGLFEQPKIRATANQCLHPIKKEDDLRVKHFSEIPGPRNFPFIGSQWLYFWHGPYQSDKLHLANEDKFLKYGPVVKEHYFWNFPILHLYDKSDIETVLKWPSKFPIRPEMEALSSYRRSCPDRYSTIGIVSSQGMEWHHLRHKLASKVVSPSLGTKIVEELSLVSDELIEKLRRDRDSNLGTIAQFEKYVYRFDLEVMMGILMNKRLGALKDSVPMLAKRLIHVSDRLFEICHETMYGFPWWKYFPTRSYKDLIDNENEIYTVFSELVNEQLNGMERTETSVLNDMLNTEDVDLRDKIVTLIDLVSGGIETTGNAVIFLLNFILADPRIKAKVYEELDLALLQPDTPEVYTPQLLLKLKYLRACIAESMRLSPVTPNLARLLEKDFTFQGYHAPAGSVVICQTWVASLQEENYPKAREFIPERWLSTDGVSKSNPYFEVPFGVGKRMCPGKRIAEYQLLVLTAKLLINFDMSFEEPVEAIYKFIITPKGPIKVSLRDRKN